jgi:hypothetical protein
MPKLYDWIIYSGIATFICLCVTAFLGISGINYKIHGIMGITTFVFACIHGGLVLYKRMKIRQAKK